MDSAQMADKMFAALTGQPTIPWEELPPFNLEAALRGEPCVFVSDYHHAAKFGFRERVCTDCRRIAEPHSGVMIYAGEWLVYNEGTGDDSVEQMSEHFRMIPKGGRNGC